MIDMSEWRYYYGQEGLKRQLAVHMTAAQMMGKALPHILLASGNPGHGKTAAAELIAITMGKRCITLIPPFTEDVLLRALRASEDGGIVYIDEIHRMKKSSEMLLRLLEGGEMYVRGRSVPVPAITVIASTTDPDLLPQPVLDRFKIKPTFDPYTMQDLINIAYSFALRNECTHLFREDENGDVSELLEVVATSCRGIPRIAGEMIVAIQALAFSLERVPTVMEFLDFIDVDPDGMTAPHREYLQTLYTNFRKAADTESGFEYVASETTMMTMLRQTKSGLYRLERFLTERGFIERTGRGRVLTDKGVERCHWWKNLRAGVVDRYIPRAVLLSA
jgi:Holliday junction DNA helicase RuvB